MKIDIVKVGYLKTNCYIVSKGSNAIIIDPGDEADKIISFIKDNNLKVLGVYVTHTHFDHVMALNSIEKEFKVKCNEFKNNVDKMEVINTPGHHYNSLTFYYPDEKVMFTGDFLFEGTIGRTDLDESDNKEMVKSLDVIAKYPDDITIFPGHGRKSNLGIEKHNFKFYLTML